MPTGPCFNIIQWKMSKLLLQIIPQHLIEITSALVRKHNMPFYRSGQNFGTITLNFHNRGFNDVIFSTRDVSSRGLCTEVCLTFLHFRGMNGCPESGLTLKALCFFVPVKHWGCFPPTL